LRHSRAAGAGGGQLAGNGSNPDQSSATFNIEKQSIHYRFLERHRRLTQFPDATQQAPGC